MMKAVIIDDEALVIQGLQRMVDWERHSVELVGTASDGLAGFELILEKKPDLVFIDIRMPGMDGLSVIEKIRALYPAMGFIILSGYQEFEYAKKAIALGVLEYLEKPVTVGDIEDVLKKARLSYLAKSEKSADEKKGESYLLSLLQRNPWPQEMVGQLLETPLKIKNAKEFSIVAAQLSQWKNGYPHDMDILHNAFFVKAMEGNIPFIFSSFCGQFVILAGTNSQILYQMLFDCQRECRHVSISFCAAISESFTNLLDIALHWNQARHLLGNILFTGHTIILPFIPSTQEEPNLSLDTTFQNQLLLYIRIDEYQKAKELLQEFFRTQENSSFDKNAYIHIMLELMNIVLSGAHETGKLFSDKDGGAFIPHVEIQDCLTMKALEEWFFEKVEEIFDWIKIIRGSDYHKSILMAKDYINENYYKNLSLFELANATSLNASYFSNLFKEEVGISYVKYLTKIRMEKAAELLQYGLKASEVAEKTGYQNSRYFGEVFKKYYGVTPSQFRGIPNADV